ncbi:hypothetical protein PI739_02915 [Pseudomonas cerasi]|uniref:hypothetical protein n=1 Tax=Pseudomonas cerasi TaxID=1583341 RepID=UPI0023007A62|nr:hypothetical protein [Pseudomonas cerasi]MDA7011302.1 hypothetical protein [Pseudomonas cerasi]
MATPYEFTSQGAAMSAAMTLIGSTRKRFVVKEVLSINGLRRWVVAHHGGNPAIPFERFAA